MLIFGIHLMRASAPIRLLQLVPLLGVLAGCASQPLTPIQEKANAAFEDCRKEGWSARLLYVTPEGAFQFEGRADEIFKVKRCLEQRYGYRFAN